MTYKEAIFEIFAAGFESAIADFIASNDFKTILGEAIVTRLIENIED